MSNVTTDTSNHVMPELIDEGVWLFDTKRPGRTVCIMGGVHGNEHAGKLVVQTLAKEGLLLSRGKVFLIHGNPKASEQNVRGTEADLNRSFRALTNSEKAVPFDSLPYEVRRAQKLMPYMDECVSLLDMHESHSSHIEPFIICEAPDLPLALLIGAHDIAINFTEAEPGGTDGYMHKKRRGALCYELGYFTQSVTNARFGLRVVERFLSVEGLIDKGFEPLLSRNPTRIIKARKGLVRGKDEFVFEQMYRSFDSITAGEVLGYSGEAPVIAEQTGVIIFPNRSASVGQEVFSYGEILDMTEVRKLLGHHVT